MSIREVLPFAELDWRIEPPPAWFEPSEPDWEFEAPEGSAVALLLVDEQQHLPSQSISNRIVRQLLTPAGVASFRQVEIAFDAKTRRLCIHELVVWSKSASGAWQGQSVTNSVNFQVRAPGPQSGRVSIVAQIDWLQAGDAVDISWTLEPLDSVPELPFSTFHGFVWNVPCGVTHFTIYPDHQSAAVKYQLHCPQGVQPPEEDFLSGRLHWRQSRPPITRLEPNTPPGVWNFPVLEASGWRDWNEVAEDTHAFWAVALAENSAPVADAAARLSTSGDLITSVSEIIRFVQDGIADTDDESGPAALLFPDKPGTVLARSSGTPKDKAVLLTALLGQIGVEACPVLVNPDWQETLASLLPTPAVFNHVIVTFGIDGHRYFADPAEPSQKGTFLHWTQPSYGAGLEIKPGASGLLSLPPPPTAELTLTETFRLASEGTSGSVEQVLRATHWLADEMRESIARDGRTLFIQAHIDALESQFPALSADAASVTLREESDGSAIEMRGIHDLPFFPEAGESGSAEFRYRANGLLLAVEWTETPESRTMPRALRHPMRVRHIVQVEGDFIRQAQPEQRIVTGPSFRYHGEVTLRQGLAIFDHAWETTAPQVEAGRWAEYCAKASEVFAQLEISLPIDSPGALTTKTADEIIEPFQSSAPKEVFASSETIAADEIIEPFQSSEPKEIFASSETIAADEIIAALESNPPNEISEAIEIPTAPQPTYQPARKFRSALLFSLLAIGILGGVGIAAKLVGSRGTSPQAPPAPEVQAEVQKALEAASQGDLTSAQPLLEKRQEEFKEDPAFQFVRAEVALRTGQLDKAREALDKAKTLDPTNVNNEVLTAILHRAEGDGSSAKQLLTEATERNPNDPRPVRELALTLAQEGDPQGALKAWARVLELAPGDADALRQYAVLLWQNGQQTQADAIISQALAAQTTPNAALEAAAGDYYTLTGRRAEALNRLEKAASLDPGDRTRDFALASGHLRMGRTQEAALLATKLTQDFPTDVRAWQVLAVAKSILGDQTAAEAAYREWLRLAPQDPKGPANFGYFLLQSGRHKEAREFLASSTEKFPREGMIWLNYAAVLDALGEPQPAIEARQRASELLTAEEKQLLIR